MSNPEAQRGQVTCGRCHGYKIPELGFELRSDSREAALATSLYNFFLACCFSTPCPSSGLSEGFPLYFSAWKGTSYLTLLSSFKIWETFKGKLLGKPLAPHSDNQEELGTKECKETGFSINVC